MSRISIALASLVAVVSLSAPVLGAELDGVVVRYRSSETIYLSNGAAAGLAEGDRLEVLRAENSIGEIVVVYVAEHSASCRIVDESTAIAPDDRVRLVAKAEASESQQEAPPVATDTDSATTDSTWRRLPVVALPTSSSTSSSGSRERRSPTRVSGVFTLGWESFQDDGEAGLDFERLQARLNLRVRNIAGRPYEFRLRVRGQENKRQRAYSNGAPETESRNRLYEMALVYAPVEGRFAYQVGRIGTSPFVGIGFLDGVVGQAKVVQGVDVGAFFGSRPLIEEFGFESFGKKYGGYARFSGLRDGPRPAFELLLAGTREDGKEDVSREYVTMETRYTPGGRWSLYQRAEIDLNNGWREEASGSSSQLSNLSFTVDTRLTQFTRFAISYDRYERYREEETRSIPDELFDDLLRQGLRARFSFGRPGGLGFWINAGLRDREDDEDNTVTYGAGLRHPDIAHWGLSLGGDVLGYSNPLTEGYVLRGYATKRFRAGHELALLVGGRLSQDQLFDDEDRNDQWIRLSGWVELPKGLFANGEYELSDGDDLEGQRILLGLGYHF